MTDRYFAIELAKQMGITITEAISIFDRIEVIFKDKMHGQTQSIHFLDLLCKQVTVKGSNCSNPQTQEIIYTPPYKKLKVSLSKDWKMFLNGEHTPIKEEFLVKREHGNVSLDDAVDSY